MHHSLACLNNMDIRARLLQKVKSFSRYNQFFMKRTLRLRVSKRVKEYIVQIIKLDLSLVDLTACPRIDLHELSLSLDSFFMLL